MAEERFPFDYFVTGPRMGLQTPLALEKAGLLESLHTDICLTPGLPATTLQSLFGQRVAGRVVDGVPVTKLRLHPQLFLLARARGRRILAGRDTDPIDRLLVRAFIRIAQRCTSPAVMGVQSNCLELFRDRGLRMMEQVSPPRRYEQLLAVEELRRFPGWAEHLCARRSSWDRRMEEEWQMADVVCVPSPHLIPISAQFGADPAKFAVLPYPLPPPDAPAGRRGPHGGHALRVVFAGTLMLEKGVQYIYEALWRWACSGRVDIHFFGPIMLTPTGVALLSQVGTVHGPVPRLRLLDEFRRADVLLFPSLSEGSALVTGEAAAVGLPVIATKESGAPIAAIPIEARSSAAIRTTLERLLDEPGLLEQSSQTGLAESAQRTMTNYSIRLAEVATRGISPRRQADSAP